jgi:NDP-sugar pyrophosphorylase family protein
MMITEASGVAGLDSTTAATDDDLVVVAVAAPFAAPTTVLEALASCDAGDAYDDEDYGDGGRWIHARSNVISRAALVEGAAHVSMAGDSVVRAGAVVRGDLARVKVGRYSDIGAGAVLKPPGRVGDPPALAYVPQVLGSHVHVGAGAVVEAAALGAGARVGPRAVVGKSAVLKDYVARPRRVRGAMGARFCMDRSAAGRRGGRGRARRRRRRAVLRPRGRAGPGRRDAVAGRRRRATAPGPGRGGRAAAAPGLTSLFVSMIEVNVAAAFEPCETMGSLK